MELYLYEFEANSSLPSGLFSFPTLEVKTCQRSFLLSWDELDPGCARRIFKGSEAYEFLLRFACGLESEIKGETDVFGQLKTSIKTFLEKYPEVSSEQTSLFSKLFEDTKEVRAQYLQGIGGNTYGALARRLLSPEPESRVLLLGAGQISKSIAPYFADSKLTIYNRTDTRLKELEFDLRKKGYSSIHYVSDSADLEGLIRSTDLIVIATPPGSELDSLVHDTLLQIPVQMRPRVLHLGGQSHDLGIFKSSGMALLSLTDLFTIEKEQNFFREKQIKQAIEACRNRAILRSLSRSIHIPHGWEDLALFY